MTSAVPRLHQFQADHPEVEFTAPHMGGRGRYLARVPAGTLPGDDREHALSSIDLTGLMDQLGDLFPAAAACLECGMRDPPPEPTCNLGRDHRVGTAAGCGSCGRLAAACEQRPCSARRIGAPP